MNLRMLLLLLCLFLPLTAHAGPSDTAMKETAKPKTITMETTMGRMVLELYDDKAPITCENFRRYVREGFYDGLIFHRVIDGFMIQGGCPSGTGTGGPGYRFDDEFDSSLRHNSAGILSMANAGPGTNGSQFFITLGSTPHLNDNHSVFGKVTEGLDVVKKIGSTKTGPGDRPVEDVVIERVTIRR